MVEGYYNARIAANGPKFRIDSTSFMSGGNEPTWARLWS